MPLDWSGWLLRVLTWDGLVPVAMFVSSMTVARLTQGQGDWYLALTLGLPLSAFLVRFFMGRGAIERNHCSPVTQSFQSIVLVLGLIVIAILDSLLICLSTLPPGNPGGNRDKVVILYCVVAMVYLAYLACMCFAMYPGRESLTSDEDEHLAPDLDEG